MFFVLSLGLKTSTKKTPPCRQIYAARPLGGIRNPDGNTARSAPQQIAELMHVSDKIAL